MSSLIDQNKVCVNFSPGPSALGRHRPEQQMADATPGTGWPQVKCCLICCLSRFIPCPHTQFSLPCLHLSVQDNLFGLTDALRPSVHSISPVATTPYAPVTILLNKSLSSLSLDFKKIVYHLVDGIDVSQDFFSLSQKHGHPTHLQ